MIRQDGMQIAPLVVVPQNPLRTDGGGSSDADATQEVKTSAWGTPLSRKSSRHHGIATQAIPKPVLAET
jgi:hypothetical protein